MTPRQHDAAVIDVRRSLRLRESLPLAQGSTARRAPVRLGVFSKHSMALGTDALHPIQFTRWTLVLNEAEGWLAGLC